MWASLLGSLLLATRARAGAQVPELSYIKRCAGNLEAAVVSQSKPTDRPDYCIALPSRDADFDPDFFQPAYAGDEPLDKLLLLIRAGARKPECKLIVRMDKKVPRCTECDGGCYRLKKTERATKTYSLDFKNGKTLLLDIGADMISDWSLMGLSIRTILDCGKSGKKTRIQKVPGWGWCA